MNEKNYDDYSGQLGLHSYDGSSYLTRPCCLIPQVWNQKWSEEVTMNKNERNSNRAARNIRVLGILVIIGFCCITMVSPVAATTKWLTDNETVYANMSYYATINGTSYQNNNFFAIIGNSHFNSTSQVRTYEAWNYCMDPTYTKQYYLRQLRVKTILYPNFTRQGDFRWLVVNNLSCDGTFYNKALGGWVNNSGTYYLWFGNRTAATSPSHRYAHWICPTYENAMYVVNLTVICDDGCT